MNSIDLESSGTGKLSGKPFPENAACLGISSHNGSDLTNPLINSPNKPSGLKPPPKTCVQRSRAKGRHCSDRKDGESGNSLGSHTLSYMRWCARLTPMVLSTRSAFAAFLSRTIKLSRLERDAKTIPTFFPIPLPYMGVYGRMPVTSPAKDQDSRHISKAVHVMVSALNFWYSGGEFGQVDLLRRRPSEHHLKLYQRLRLLIESDGNVEVDNLPSVGRRFPELIARISEISDKLAKLGPSADPYDQTFKGVTVEKTEEPIPELRPFHDMDPEKLKIHGTGHWDATSFLDDDICMAYREPRSILHGLPTPPGVLIRDAPETLAALAHKWDAHGLLHLHDKEVHPDSLVRIFGAFKDFHTHRQIGDRRGQNQRECRLVGPSSDLPSGCDLCDLFVDPRTQKVFISISDRRDFYHQIRATEARALCNTIGPAVPLDLLRDTKAFSLHLIRSAKKRFDRIKQGDGLFADSFNDYIRPPTGHLWVAFSSVLQGDHAGVEIATQAHTNLLKSYGLLGEEYRMVASKPLRSNVRAEGLVIDDYFSLSFEDKDLVGASQAEKSYKLADDAYKGFGLLGSPHKDLIGVQEGRIIGAYLNASQRAVDRDVVTVAAPARKRIALSYLSLQVAQLPITSDSLHLCLLGGWVSMLGYRRPMMAILQDSFKVVDMLTFDREHPRAIQLTRKVAGELVLLAVLAPLAVTDISVPFSRDIYCTDASLEKGAILKASVSKDVAEVLWKTSKSKGAYSRLLSPVECLLKQLGSLEEFSLEKHRWQGGESARLERPPAFHFDFIEVFSGASKITHFLSEWGYVVGPPLDISISEEYNLEKHYVLSWLVYMLTEKRLLGFFAGPPCTTFSIMRRPRLRSREQPFGFDTSDSQTQLGNNLAHRSGQLVYAGHRSGASGILETPYGSYMKHLPFWLILRRLSGASEVRSGSCRFGSVHLKSFRFLGVHVNTSKLALRCNCSGKHVQVQGSFTKASATYTDALAHAIALVLAEGIEVQKRRTCCFEELQVKGLESQLSNEVMQTAAWKPWKVWSFKKRSHINIHDPTRDRECRNPLLGLDLNAWDKDQLYNLAALPKLRRWASNWVRLVLLSLGPACLLFHDRSVYRVPPEPESLSGGQHGVLDFDSTLGFPGEGPCDSILTSALSVLCFVIFGIFLSVSLLSFLALPCRWISITGPWTSTFRRPTVCVVGLSSRLSSRLLLLLLFSLLPVATAMPISATTPAEARRMLERQGRPELRAGRPVTDATSSLREKYRDVFRQWTVSEGLVLDDILLNYMYYIDDLNFILVRYGRTLYAAGKSYNQYAETLNALTALKPGLRRMLTAAWDLGIAWTKQEPSQHHIPVPAPILIAMITVAIMWGWMSTAGLLALGFGGLLRPGEMVAALRQDLLLPSDTGFTTSFVLLSIREPKSRFTYARQQTAKVDSADLVQVIEIAFGKLRGLQRLWPFSAQTLRTRFRSLLQALQLPVLSSPGSRCLDLGSLRSGGATFIILSTENGELCRRRGRWANAKMMEIYVQGSMALQYLLMIPQHNRFFIFAVAGNFLHVVQQAKVFREALIPESAWYFLFSSSQ